MTRDEFLEEITTWQQLRDFCEDNGCGDYLMDIYSEEDRDGYVDDCIVDWARDYTWTELYSILDNIPTGYEYYRLCEDGDWEGLTQADFDAFKDDVADWCDRNDIWDEEYTEEDDEEEAPEEDEEEDDSEPVDEEPPIEDEDFSLDELFLVGIGCIRDIEESERVMAAEAEKEFATLLF